MRIEQELTLERPADEVWAFLKDVPAVAACIPGAELTDIAEDHSFRGAFRLKVGPLSVKLDGEGRLERDDQARTGKIEGKGVDRRGGSRVSATMSYQVESAGDGARLRVIADLNLAGQLSQIGRTGLIEDVAKRLTSEFSEALAARLVEPSAAEQTPESDVSPPPSDPAATAPPAAFDVGRAAGASLLNRVRRGLTGRSGDG